MGKGWAKVGGKRESVAYLKLAKFLGSLLSLPLFLSAICGMCFKASIPFFGIFLIMERLNVQVM